MLVASVETKRGEPDRELANHFLDSLRFDQPFRVFAFAEAGLSVAIPALTVELDQHALGVDGALDARAFYVGGRNQIVYSVSAFEILPDSVGQATPDERMDAGVEALVQNGGSVSFQAPLEFERARGRE